MRLRVMTVTLLCQFLFLGLVLLSDGLLRWLFFGGFWLSTLGTLLLLLNLSFWTASDWLVFGSFGSSVIIVVLWSARLVVDIVGLLVPLLALLLVAAFLSSLPRTVGAIRRMPDGKPPLPPAA